MDGPKHGKKLLNCIGALPLPKNRRVASLLRIVKLFSKLVCISEQEADGQDHQHASTADYHPGHLKGDFGNSNQGKNDEFVLI